MFIIITIVDEMAVMIILLNEIRMFLQMGWF